MITPKWCTIQLNRVLPNIRKEVDFVFPISARYGKHSIVGNIQLQVHSTGHTEDLINWFLKRAYQDELPARSEINWQRDLRSYKAEVDFYKYIYPLLHQTLPLAKPYVAECMKDKDDGHYNQFLLILQDIFRSSVGNPIQYESIDFLNKEQIKGSLTYAANLHALGWTTPAVCQTANAYLWPLGCWWTQEKRGSKSTLQEKIPSNWEHVLAAFKNELQESGMDTTSTGIQTLGHRLLKATDKITALLDCTTESNMGLCTIVHGDFKSANLAFKKTNNESEKVLAYDWQWSGIGLGAMDVAYLLNTSAAIDCILTIEDEESLLHWYFTCLMGNLNLHTQHHDTEIQIKLDICKRYTFEAFKLHYQCATLEYALVLMATMWQNMTPESCHAKYGNSNCGLGYRSIPHVIRMIYRMDGYLNALELQE